MTSQTTFEFYAIDRVTGVLDNISQQLDNVKKQAESTVKKTSSVMRELRNAFLGMGLTLLFTGMAIKRYADQAMRAIINTYAKVMGDTSEFAVLTNQLSANWIYFKFTLMDALMQSGLFQMFIGFLINLIQGFSELPQAAKVGIVLILGGLILMGGLMMVIGQAILPLATNWAVVGANVKAVGTLISTVSTAFLGFLPTIALVAVLIGVVIALFLLFTTPGDKVRKVITAIGLVLIAVGAILAFVGVTFGWWLLLIGALVIGVAYFKEELLQFGIMILTLFVHIIKIALWPFLTTIQLIIDAVYVLINAWRRWQAMKSGTAFKALEAPQIKGAVDNFSDAMYGKLAEWNDSLETAKQNRGGFWERLGFGSAEEAATLTSNNPAGETAPTIDNSVHIESVTVENPQNFNTLLEEAREYNRQYGGSTFNN